MRPSARREVAGHLQAAYGISERRACRATGFHRSSQRYRKRSDPQTELRMRLKELAAAQVCSGDRRLHVLLRREGSPVNHTDRLENVHPDELAILVLDFVREISPQTAEEALQARYITWGEALLQVRCGPIQGRDAVVEMH